MTRSRKQCVAYCARSKSGYKILPCGHSIHFACLWKWHCESREKRRGTTCPVCRGTVYEYTPEYRSTKERIQRIFDIYNLLLDAAFFAEKEIQLQMIHDYAVLSEHYITELRDHKFAKILKL